MRLTLTALLYSLEAVRGFSEAEFEEWLAEGRFDMRAIDGEPRFISSVKNLFWRYPELEPRRTTPKDTAAYQWAVLETCVAITKAVRRTGAPYVSPTQIRVTMTVTASANAAPAGETIRAWLPVPRRYAFQGGFRLLGSSSPSAGCSDPAGLGIGRGFGEHRGRLHLRPRQHGRRSRYGLEEQRLVHGVCAG
mgnify:FL=1